MSFTVGDKVRIKRALWGNEPGTHEIKALNGGRYPGFGEYGLKIGNWPIENDGDYAYYSEEELEEA